jgi:hypothetical protein
MVAARVRPGRIAALGLAAALAIPAEAAPGRVRWRVAPPRDPRLAVVAPVFENPRLPALTAAVGELLVLPRDLHVVVDQCDAVDSFYDPAHHRVVLCYELAGFFGLMFERKANVDPSRQLDYALNGMTFTLLHELGHAIIGELDLGVTGGEEDAVDDFAALLLLELKEPGLAVDGAEAMLDLGMLSQGQARFSDEHSLSPQRFYNVLCLAYGADPGTVAPVAVAYLPQARAVRCADEYRKKRKAWEAMTEPYTRHAPPVPDAGARRRRQ